MAYSYDKERNQLVFEGWEKGIAGSPHKGIGDLKCADITTIPGEVSVNFDRVRLDNAPVIGGTISCSSAVDTVLYTGTPLTNGTWVQVTAISSGGPSNFTVNDYYYLVQDFGSGNNEYLIYSDLGVTGITPNATGTLTFKTLNMGMPVDYTVEQTTTYDEYRYYLIDNNGIVWCSGAGGTPLSAGALSTDTVWTAITPNGSSTHPIPHTGSNSYGISIFYATTNGAITHTYLFGLSDNGIYYLESPSAGGTFTAFTGGNPLKFTDGQPHKAILGVDQVLYFTDGPLVGFLLQADIGTPFDPTTASTYIFSHGTPFVPYYLNPSDTATRIAQVPNQGGMGLLVGGLQDYLYTYSSAKSAVASGSAYTGQPQNILWMPESNTQYLIQANNYVIIFAGNKGNIYLTNSSNVVPILTIPDYVAGAADFMQEPYYRWGGAAYIRGRIFFSIEDYNLTNHTTGNCGGVWSFVPTFSYFPEQDVGTALRLETQSTLNDGYNPYAPIIFGGVNSDAQHAQGAQYLAAWWDENGGISGIDFSGTDPYTGGQTIIETDFVQVGTLYQKETFKQIEVAFTSALATGESVEVKYRTDLEVSFQSAGTMITESDPLSYITDKLTFEKAQSIQLQIILTSVAATSNPSYCRMRKVYLR